MSVQPGARPTKGYSILILGEGWTGGDQTPPPPPVFFRSDPPSPCFLFVLKNVVGGYTNICSYEFMCNGYIMGHRKQPYIDFVKKKIVKKKKKKCLVGHPPSPYFFLE